MSNPTTVSALGSQTTLQIVYGATQPLQFTLLEREIGATTFTAVNLAGATVKFTVRQRLGGPLVFTKVNAPGEHQDDAQGTTRFTVAPEDFASLNLAASQQWTTLVFEVRRIEDSPLQEFVHISGDLILKMTPQPEMSSTSPSPSPSA